MSDRVCVGVIVGVHGVRGAVRIKSFTEVRLDSRWRPRHGFLTPEAWEAALTHAGFQDLLSVPPPRPLMDQHPNFNAGAFSARA